MVIEIDIKESNIIIGEFMGGYYIDCDSWKADREKCSIAHILDNAITEELLFNKSWDWLMPVIDKINGMGKEYHFAMFKTYFSLTVEKGGKVYKDFSFADSEIKYQGKEIEGAYKLVVKFINWHNANKL